MFVRKIVIAGIYCGIAFAVASLLVGCKKQNAFVAPLPPQITLAHLLRDEVTPYVELTGNAQAVNQVDLVARVRVFWQTIRLSGWSIGEAGRHGVCDRAGSV